MKSFCCLLGRLVLLLTLVGGSIAAADEGCVEHMGATDGCARESPAWTGADTSSKLDLDGEYVGWTGIEAERVPCEESIAHMGLESLVPTTYPNTTHHRCRQDHSFCCFQTPARGSRSNTWFEAFNMIEGRKHIWRLHFTIDKKSLKITGQLRQVVQFCKNPFDMGECEGGETEQDQIPDLPDDDNGVNILEDSQDIVYDDGGT